MTLSGSIDQVTARSFFYKASNERSSLHEDAFRRMILIERKRTERSKCPFLLMLIDGGGYQAKDKNGKGLDTMMAALLQTTRETDIIGWYKEAVSAGAIFTGLETKDKNLVLGAILSRVSNTLRDNLTCEQFNKVSISFHFFPDDWDGALPDQPNGSVLYPDINPDQAAKANLGIKRAMDVVGGLLALAIISPLWLAIVIAIKVSSKGPVFFRQHRVGQYGRHFTFLKFRSMYVDNDPAVHKEYVTNLINGKATPEQSREKGESLYKLINDKRITRVGRFLRRTSLDELPQLLNVLEGEMSLVGPRPAIPYEVTAYQTWHRRRVLEVKPGITGLWQVNGRSRVKFDDMVRLDLQYAKSWTPWLDFKILLLTPRAVVMGTGAY